MKYHDNITKICALSLANILVFLYSVFVSHQQELSAPFVLGAGVVIAGVYTYQKHQTRARSAPDVTV